MLLNPVVPTLAEKGTFSPQHISHDSQGRRVEGLASLSALQLLDSVLSGAPVSPHAPLTWPLKKINVQAGLSALHCEVRRCLPPALQTLRGPHRVPQGPTCRSAGHTHARARGQGLALWRAILAGSEPC